MSRKTMGHNRRADGDGLWIESHKRSEAETCKNPRGSIAHSLKGCGIHFVNGVEDVKIKEYRENCFKHDYGEKIGLVHILNF